MTSSPACIGELENSWPWHQKLPGLTLITTRFDPTTFDTNDFERCGVEVPEAIRKAVPKRQSEYLAGRLCAQAAIREAVGAEASPTRRPDRAPQWPPGCVGAITHGNGTASAIVGQSWQYASLGIDLETRISDERAQSLIQKILTPDEQLRFADSLTQHPGDFLTLAFSLKESLFKTLYPLTNTRFYFQHAELLEWHSRGTARLRLLTHLSDEWRPGVELDGLFAPLYAKRPNQYLSLITTKARQDALCKG